MTRKPLMTEPHPFERGRKQDEGAALCRHCEMTFTTGPHGDREILLAALLALEADRDRARDAAVALEQENARLTELTESLQADEKRMREQMSVCLTDRGEFRADRDRARDAAVALEQENAYLAELTATCTCCDGNPANYEGVHVDCAVHGAVRAYNETQAITERVRQYAASIAKSGSHAYAKAGRELLAILDGGERL